MNLLSFGLDAVERGLVPDMVTRAAIRPQFLLAVAELFGPTKDTEWFVSPSLLQPIKRSLS